MRILFVHAAAEFSIYEYGWGYRRALEALGHDVKDYKLYNHIKYHGACLGKPKADNAVLLSRQASIGVLAQAHFHQADLVVVTSGLSFHPDALWLLAQGKFPVACIFTESPYSDEQHEIFTSVYPEMVCFTNDRYSAERHGWHYLPPAHDPEIHRPVEADPDWDCDVLILGTGWDERQALLESVNWRGIKVRIAGIWPGIGAESPLHLFYRPGCVDNTRAPSLYAAAKICLNQHRSDPNAKTFNPRAIELAACGAFQLSDAREDLVELFGDSVPTYEDGDSLERLARRFLRDDAGRQRRAEASRIAVRENHTFTARAMELVEVLMDRLSFPATA